MNEMSAPRGDPAVFGKVIKSPKRSVRSIQLQYYNGRRMKERTKVQRGQCSSGFNKKYWTKRTVLTGETKHRTENNYPHLKSETRLPKYVSRSDHRSYVFSLF
jgi:hypothetical protein